MPGYKVHLAGGLVAATLVVGMLLYYGVFSFGSWMGFAVLGVLLFAIMPDVDVRTSKAFLIWSIFATGSMLLFVMHILFKGLPEISVVLAMTGVAILYFFSLFARHRGFFHKYSTGIIFAIPVWVYFGVPTGIAVLSAYWSHLILDKVRPDSG